MKAQRERNNGSNNGDIQLQAAKSVKISARTLLWESAAILVLAILAAGGTLVWRLSQGPLDLSFLKPQVEAALTDARGGLPVTLQGVALEWSQDRRRIEAAARGLRAYDENGGLMGDAARAVIAVDSASLIRGRIKTLGVRLEDGAAKLWRAEDGNWSTSPPRADEVTNAEPPSTNLDLSNWRTFLPPIRRAIADQSFERVDLENFTLELIDAANGVTWVAQPLSGAWRADTDGVSLKLEAALRGEGAPTRASFSASADAEVESLSASIELDGVTLSQMADLFAPADLPVAFEGATNVSLSATASEDLGVETIELSASSNGGQFVWGDLTRNVDRLAIDIGLDIAGRQLDIVDFDVDAEGFGGRYSARVDLEEFFEGVEAPDFPITLSAEDIVFDATPMFEAPWSISSLELGGRVNPAERTLDIGRAIGSAGSFNATASGEIYLGEFDGVTEVGVRLEAAGEGASTEDALAFWPVNLGKGARDWVKQNVSAGRITEAVYAMNFPPGANSRGFLDNDVLNLAFSLEG
ncbi:MAG: hypothetical protein AAF719_12560, partial [Pseudomonadota bacterium]